MKNILIKEVLKNSIADDLKIEAGDFLVSINNTEIQDILDYKYQIFDENITLIIKKASGEEWELEIEKEENEDIGIIFKEQLIEPAKNCANKCIFCFMDQLPKDVRDTLVFKDDDFRLSFFTGNYVTLTNSGYKDLERIVKYHLSPINISVHATDPEVRKMMLNNKNAGKIIEYIKYLTDNGIKVNAQIVLCRGINDGNILDKTISDLSTFFPELLCIAIVPVGLSKYRKGLYKLESFEKESSDAVIKQIEVWQKQFIKKYNSNIVYLADEFYIQAGKEIPPFRHYEDFPQLEDGIGMLAYFTKQFNDYLYRLQSKEINKTVSIITGKITYNYIIEKTKILENKYKGLKINVYPIENNFFGKNITVTGLITGGDIINQLKNKDLGEYLIIPNCTLKSDDDVFLDNITLKEVSDKLSCNIVVSANNGKDFIKSIIRKN
jgi:putative radical SAM enzyme (TIGR03279 family)